MYYFADKQNPDDATATDPSHLEEHHARGANGKDQGQFSVAVD
jgi:hypothetical protein